MFHDLDGATLQASDMSAGEVLRGLYEANAVMGLTKGALGESVRPLDVLIERGNTRLTVEVKGYDEERDHEECSITVPLYCSSPSRDSQRFWRRPEERKLESL